VRSVGTTIHQESLGPHHILRGPSQQPADAPSTRINPHEHNRILYYLASLVILCRLETRTVLREVAVEVMCTEQIQMTMTVHRVAGASVLMEVIQVIQVIWVIIEIVEIVVIVITGGTEVSETFVKMDRDDANEMSPGHRGEVTVMMGIRRLSCQ